MIQCRLLSLAAIITTRQSRLRRPPSLCQPRYPSPAGCPIPNLRTQHVVVAHCPRPRSNGALIPLLPDSLPHLDRPRGPWAGGDCKSGRRRGFGRAPIFMRASEISHRRKKMMVGGVRPRVRWGWRGFCPLRSIVSPKKNRSRCRARRGGEKCLSADGLTFGCKRRPRRTTLVATIPTMCYFGGGRLLSVSVGTDERQHYERRHGEERNNTKHRVDEGRLVSCGGM